MALDVRASSNSGRVSSDLIAFNRGLVLCLALLVSCPERRTGDVTLAGSTSVEPFAERLAELYSAQHREVKINVQGGGSSAGIRAVSSGICQIGMSSRHLTEEEKGLDEIPIALDAIVLIVNRENPIRGVTLEQARNIFAGRTRFWSELGGPHRPITVITREDGSGTRASFEEAVMVGPGKRVEPFARDALVQDSNGAVREIVARDLGAIGYISLGLLDNRVRALSLDGVVPAESTIWSGQYPVVRRFLFLTRGFPSQTASAFIDYVLSPAGQQVLADEGLTPIGR